MKKILPIIVLTLLSSTAFAKDNTKPPILENQKIVKSDQDKWWHDKDVNNDGKISLKEYVDSETKNDKKTIKEANDEFKMKDKDHDGFISANEFKAWFEKAGDKVVSGTKKIESKTVELKDDLKKDYKESDINHNGK